MLAPQGWAAGRMLSSSWIGQGAVEEAGGVSTATTVARMSSEIAGGVG